MSTAKTPKLYVEYCGAWGYAPKYAALEKELNEKFPGQLEVSGGVGRRSSFEITIGNSDTDKVVLFSKLKDGAFPDPDSLRAAITKYLADGSVSEVTKAQGGGCSIQ